MGSTGKRAAARRKRSFQPALLGLALGVTLCVVAWGYLVKAAIDFGTSARGGESLAWAFLALASLGAVACLFVGLILVARITRRLGITDGGASGRRGSSARDSSRRSSSGGADTAELPTAGPMSTPPQRVPGGRRAAR